MFEGIQAFGVERNDSVLALVSPLINHCGPEHVPKLTGDRSLGHVGKVPTQEIFRLERNVIQIRFDIRQQAPVHRLPFVLTSETLCFCGNYSDHSFFQPDVFSPYSAGAGGSHFRVEHDQDKNGPFCCQGGNDCRDHFEYLSNFASRKRQPFIIIGGFLCKTPRDIVASDFFYLPPQCFQVIYRIVYHAGRVGIEPHLKHNRVKVCLPYVVDGPALCLRKSDEQGFIRLPKKRALGRWDAFPDYVFPEPTKNESGRRRFCIFSQNLFCTKFGAGFMFLLIHPASGPSFNIVSLLLRQPRKLCFCTCITGITGGQSRRILRDVSLVLKRRTVGQSPSDYMELSAVILSQASHLKPPHKLPHTRYGSSRLPWFFDVPASYQNCEKPYE